jgi:hypothetical protein
MSEDTVKATLARIERAIVRIESAANSRVQEARLWEDRHQQLRDRVESAVAALDDLLASGALTDAGENG